MKINRLRYIEIIQTIKINEIIADTKLIHATYIIFPSGVKPQAQKLRLLVNEKGKSICWIHPFELRYDLDIQNDFGVDVDRIMAVICDRVFLLKK